MPRAPVYGPEHYYRAILAEMSPDAVASALASLTAGDVRAMFLSYEEFCASFDVLKSAGLSRMLTRMGAPLVQIGNRRYISKLALIRALHHDEGGRPDAAAEALRRIVQGATMSPTGGNR